MPAAHNPALWIEEIRTLVATMERQHPNLYHRHPKAVWEAAIEQLERRLPNLAWHEAVASVVKLVALAADGHTAIFDLPAHGPGFDQRYPVVLWFFTDGLYVRQTLAPYTTLFGKRVTHINGFAVRAVMDTLRPYISAENEAWFLHNLPNVLQVPGLLCDAALAAHPNDPLCLTVTDGACAAVVEVEPVPAEALLDWLAADDSGNASQPLPHYRLPLSHYTFHWDEAQRLLYVDHRTVRDADHETLAAFSERIFHFAAQHSVEKLVLDIRQNGGGNLSLNQPLVHGVLANPLLNQPGKLFVITGRGTFSAAMHLASYMERETHALFVGEPTGSSPNHFGDPEPIELPHLGLTVFCSTVFWQNSEPWDERPWIVPDLPAPLSFADFAARRDPALEAIRACQPDPHAVHRSPWLNWRRPSQRREWSFTAS